VSGNAHRGDHDIAFYEAAIEETRELSVTDAGENLDEDDGALRPGRYLIQFLQSSGPGGPVTATCWVHVGPWKNGPLTPTLGPGPRRIPLSANGIAAVETHVLADYSDRIAAIMTAAATGILYITRVSTEIRKYEVGATS
jgi:hypothetical protein